MRTCKRVVAGLALTMLGACSTLPAPDYHAALMQPCANAADTMPWAMIDSWKNGNGYAPEIRFADEGLMIYSYEGSIFDNGRWSLDGKMLHMDTNNHYADYDGTFDGKTGRGAIRNKAGETGAWVITRACEP